MATWKPPDEALRAIFAFLADRKVDLKPVCRFQMIPCDEGWSVRVATRPRRLDNADHHLILRHSGEVETDDPVRWVDGYYNRAPSVPDHVSDRVPNDVSGAVGCEPGHVDAARALRVALKYLFKNDGVPHLDIRGVIDEAEFRFSITPMPFNMWVFVYIRVTAAGEIVLK